ncbi:MAG: translesion error-prone DNA polymerase V autoproteolytic subunit [Candidatus Aquirickettsiella sp.]
MPSAYRCIISHTYLIPYLSSAVHAGFPSPADDFLEGHLDLNEYLIHHPAATYYVRVKGESMINAGIHDGDLLIVDRSLEPRDNKVVIAIVDGQLTVKRLKKLKNQQFVLIAENPDFPAIVVNEENNVSIWGIVTNVIHAV